MISVSQLRELVGHQVVMGFEDSMYGQTTLRWGTLREMSADGTTLTIDGYHDSAGLTGYMTPRDGAQIKVSELRHIEKHYPGVIH